MVCKRCRREGEGKFCSNCGASFATGTKGGLSGCGLAALIAGGLTLLMIPIGGIIAAIAIPNLLNAVQRGKQKRTMGDIRTVATAIESYGVDNEAYPVTDGWGTLEGLRASIEPTYIKLLPLVDGWGTPLEGHSSGESYVIGSAGKDGQWQDPAPEGGMMGFSCDILFSTGKFVAWPEGTQQ